MAKVRCQDMLVDLLYEAVDAGAANRDVDPRAIGRFVDTCVRPEPRGGLGRRRVSQRHRKVKR